MAIISVLAGFGLFIWCWVGFYNSLPEERKKDFRMSNTDDPSNQQ